MNIKKLKLNNSDEIIRLLFEMGLLVLFPVFFIWHSYYWISHWKSLAIAVYGLKLVFFPFLIFSIFNINKRKIIDCISRNYIILLAICFVISLSVPFFLNNNLTFFYFTDFIGLSVVVIGVPVIFSLLEKGVFSLDYITRIYSYFLVVMSVIIIVYFILSGGEKVSIPPEMHIPIALIVSAYLVPHDEGYRPNSFVIFVTALACVYSQLRENIVIFILAGAFCAVRGVFYGLPKKSLAKFVTVIILVSIFSGDLVTSRLATMRMLSIRDNSIQAVDASINQRFVEVEMAFSEMKKTPSSFLLGKGFGATYSNTEGSLTEYGKQVHNMHSSPFLFWFRNGLLGMLLFITPGVLALVSMLRTGGKRFRGGLCVALLYFALIFNQYVYWNIQYSLAISLMLYLNYMEKRGYTENRKQAA